MSEEVKAPEIKAPEAPEKKEEEKKPVPPPEPAKTPEPTPPPDGNVPEEPKVEVKPSDPNTVLFDLVDDDGNKQEVTAHEVIEKMALVDKALEVIGDNERLLTEKKNQATVVLQNPLGYCMDVLTAYYQGDQVAAYKHLYPYIEKAHKEEEAYQSLPPEEKTRREMELQIRLRDERIKKIEAERQAEEQATREANQLPKIKKILDTAISEFQLPDTDEARDLLIKALRKQRAAGKKPSIPEAVKMVQPLFSKREEGLLKATPLERLRKIRPDVVEAVKKELLEEVKQKREEETLKKPSTSSPPDQKEPVSHRIPTSRW